MSGGGILLRKGYGHSLVLVNTHTILGRERKKSGGKGGEGEGCQGREGRRESGGGDEVQEWEEVKGMGVREARNQVKSCCYVFMLIQ